MSAPPLLGTSLLNLIPDPFSTYCVLIPLPKYNLGLILDDAGMHLLFSLPTCASCDAFHAWLLLLI